MKKPFIITVIVLTVAGIFSAIVFDKPIVNLLIDVIPPDVFLLFLTYILWQYWAFTQGVEEAWYWHNKKALEFLRGKYTQDVGEILKKSKFPYLSPNSSQDVEHGFWVKERIISILLVLLPTISYLSYGFWQSVMIVVSFWLAFPLWHNGAKYANRHYMNRNVYPLGFWSEPSDSSQSITNLPVIVRIVMYVVSVILIFVAVLWK